MSNLSGNPARTRMRARRGANAGRDRARPIHISTEGPIGWAARSWCLKRGRHFTTAFHTRFPDYVSIRTRNSRRVDLENDAALPRSGERTFTATATLASELHAAWPSRIRIIGRAALISTQFNPSVHAASGVRRFATSDPAQRRSRRSREEYRGLPELGGTRQQGGRRRWSGARIA